MQRCDQPRLRDIEERTNEIESIDVCGDRFFTSPLVGQVDARSASGGGSLLIGTEQPLPPSLTLPHKGGGNTLRGMPWNKN
jgi:hypothetical protein